MSEYGHTSVLLQEAIDGLDFHPGDIFLDGTLGSGGHSEEVVKRLGERVRIIGLDMDQDALTRAETRFKTMKADATFSQGNFRNLDTILLSLGTPRVNKILLDIGLSSNQFEESGRGFSFQKDEPLEMTFKKEPKDEDITAKTIVNEWSLETLTTIIERYGEERFAHRIATAIVASREIEPIETTFELVDVITEATPAWYHHRKTHPATKTFQALRIAVNDELQALQEGLQKGFEQLAPGGRMAIISFHSLEDRIVKNYFKEKQKEEVADIITKRPLTATPLELETNRRARSAKLRILVKH